MFLRSCFVHTIRQSCFLKFLFTSPIFMTWEAFRLFSFLEIISITSKVVGNVISILNSSKEPGPDYIPELV